MNNVVYIVLNIILAGLVGQEGLPTPTQDAPPVLSCVDECNAYDHEPDCIIACGLQNCHEYDCYEWRCVAGCISERVQACVDACPDPDQT